MGLRYTYQYIYSLSYHHTRPFRYKVTRIHLDLPVITTHSLDG